MLLLEFKRLDTEKCCDYVEIHEGNKELANVSGNKLPPSVQTETDSDVTIRFTSDHSVNGKGFIIKYEYKNYTTGLYFFKYFLNNNKCSLIFVSLSG